MKTLRLALMSLSFLLIGVIATGLKADEVVVITKEQLPTSAQQFIQKHFSKYNISYVKKEKELLSHSYEVIFSEGTSIDFDKRGNWTDIDGKQNDIPVTCIPAAIQSYVKKNFSGQTFRQIERKERGRYGVELSNGLELIFDKKFRFIRVDD